MYIFAGAIKAVRSLILIKHQIMQLLGDALTVLGSRLGVSIDPVNRKSYLVRHGMHPGIPLEIHAGVEIDGKTILLPLTSQGNLFEFLDQGSTATTMTLGGIDSNSGLHLKLTIRIPFKPRDAFFSTLPVIMFELEADMLPTNFRWAKREKELIEGRMFLQFQGDGFSFSNKGTWINAQYQSGVTNPIETGTDEILGEDTEFLSCNDHLLALEGNFRGTMLENSFKLRPGEKAASLTLAWCTYDAPVLNVLGQKCRFRYTSDFNNIEQVVSWVKANPQMIRENSIKVDTIIHGHNMGEAVSSLMAQTLHSWLLNTWWVVRENGQNWFSVWEGSCYFHSTVDVEYTQTPLYLTLWPELLGYELDQWPLFGKPGSALLGERGEGTLYLSHDIGQFADCTRQRYHHDMHVEESTNYLLMAFVYWRRSGNDDMVNKHALFMRKLMDFIVACDTTGNGIPDKGCANTIDDASPAIQFGTEQIYLGVKAMAAVQVGVAMLKHAGENNLEKYSEFESKARKTIDTEGWAEDHYVVTLSKTMDGIIHPWTGEEMHGELHGWDAYHIYTQNGLALLDMIGYKTGLNEKHLRKDIETSVPQTMGEYGCRHTSYVNDNPEEILIPGLAATAIKVGWVSMNMLRDIAAAYRGIDLFSTAQKYWNWQCTTNSQQITLFFETFYGNNLHFYPRGVAIFGYFDALAGFGFDAVEGKKSFAPVRASVRVPLLLFANWDKGTVTKVNTSLNDGKIEYSIEEES
jgi:xylan 1,4-beta-xylosidase